MPKKTDDGKGEILRELAANQKGEAATHKQRNNSLCKTEKLNPREQRVINALRQRPHMREELDRIAGASNSPGIIYRLRPKGYVIPCKKVPKLDRDGKPCQPGQYRLVSEPKK